MDRSYIYNTSHSIIPIAHILSESLMVCVMRKQNTYRLAAMAMRHGPHPSHIIYTYTSISRCVEEYIRISIRISFELYIYTYMYVYVDQSARIFLAPGARDG